MSENDFQPQPAQPQPQPQPQPVQPQPTQAPPVQPQPVQAQPVQPQPMYMPPQQQKGTRGKGLGIAAMVLGIVGAVCAFIPVFNIVSFPVVIVGLILGIVSLVMARGGQGPKGFGIAGIVCSVAALIITIIMYVVIAAAAVAGTAAYDYAEENMESYSPGTGSEAVVLHSIEWNDVDSDEFFVYLNVTLENTSSDTIDLLMVELPLYDETGAAAGTAYGTVSDVAPGEFVVEAIGTQSEGHTLVFYQEELIITTL